MALNETIFLILNENALDGNSKLQPLVDAVKNRNLITFYYTGPTKGKNRVKQGDRVKAEGVAIGLTTKGNLALRAYVPSPNTSRKGFKDKKVVDKDGNVKIIRGHHWRTFLIDRMKRLAVLKETFNTQRPDYKENVDDGSFTVTYVKSDWSKEPVVIPPKEEKPTKVPITKPTSVEPTKPEPTPQQEPATQVEPEKKPSELPQPKTKAKPEPITQPTVEPKPEVAPQTVQKEPEELPQPKPETKPSDKPEDEDNNLQESIKKIKRLMFS